MEGLAALHHPDPSASAELIAGLDGPVYVERVAFRDMGEPDTITATIEPGDRLNN